MGSGGGGSSGAVSYPGYMQTIHSEWLDDSGSYVPMHNLAETIDAAYGNSPFIGRVAFDPDTYLSEALAQVDSFESVVDAFDPSTSLAAAYQAAVDAVAASGDASDTITVDETQLTADITSYDAVLTDQLNDVTLPQFQLGMLNIGAVNSSAFVMGEALLTAFKNRDVAQYGAKLRTALVTQADELNARLIISKRDLQQRLYTAMVGAITRRLELLNTVASLTVESRRIAIIAKKEESAEQADFDEKEYHSDLELFAFGQNLLAGPSGGVHQNQKTPSKAISALAGTLSGAAAGAAATGGNPYGAAAGAIIGLGLSLAQ